MSIKRRASRMSPEKRTADILAAARHVFSKRGYDDLVMAEIADQAGVVEGSIYRYFRNKRELMFRMAEDWFEEMISNDEQTLQAISGIANRLRFIIHRHLISIQEQPDLSRLVFQHLRPDPEYRSSKLFELNRAYTGRVIQIVREGVEEGELRSNISAVLVRDLIFGSIEHRTWAFLRKEGDFNADELGDELARLIWKGISLENDTGEISPLLERLESTLCRLEKEFL